MSGIKSRYTLVESVEYLKRHTETPELSVDDIVILAAGGKLSICFPYKGQLGLFKSCEADSSTDIELTRLVFGRAEKTYYFNGILRSLSRPEPSNETTDLRGHKRKSHSLHPIRVVPVLVFASDPAVEELEPEGHHWRRVYSATHLWAGTQLVSDIPQTEWMIEADGLHALTCQSTTGPRSTTDQGKSEQVSSHSANNPERREPSRRVISTKNRRDTLTPVIEQAQRRCHDSWDVAEVWATMSAMAGEKIHPLIGVTEDGIQWLKDGDVQIISRNAFAGRIRRRMPR